MTDAFDVELEDPELFAEILLLTDLMAAASKSGRPLDQAAIDSILLPGPATRRPDRG